LQIAYFLDSKLDIVCLYKRKQIKLQKKYELRFYDNCLHKEVFLIKVHEPLKSKYLNNRKKKIFEQFINGKDIPQIHTGIFSYS